MVVLLLLALSAGTVWCAATAPSGTWERSPLGETAVFDMKNAPYPHESRREGFKDKDKVFPRDPHYVDSSVALFVPKGYRPAEGTDLLFYFHGHGNNVRNALDQFKLREQVVAGGRNVILVFPQGPKDAGDSGGGKLEEPGGLERLVAEALDTLAAEGKIKSKRPRRVLLAGHSGAYRIISYCVEHGGLPDHVTDVCLCDASYARLDAFVAWAAGHERRRLFSLFTDHLANENVYLMTHLKRRKVAYELLCDEDVTDTILAEKRVLFVHTQRLKHNETVQWLERWLRSVPSLGKLEVRSEQ